MGPGESAGSFDLFEEDVDVPEDPGAQEQLRRSHSLADSYDIRPTMTGQLVHRFQTGEVFQLGATGPWFSRQEAQNTFELDVRIVGPDELSPSLDPTTYSPRLGLRAQAKQLRVATVSDVTAETIRALLRQRFLQMRDEAAGSISDEELIRRLLVSLTPPEKQALLEDMRTEIIAQLLENFVEDPEK